MGILSAFRDAGAGIKDAFTGIGNGVSSIIDSSKGQIPPELQGELKKLETELKSKAMDVEIQILELGQEAQKTLYDSMIKYEGSAEQVPKWILVLRSLIRPVLTIAFSFSFIFFMAADIANKGVEEYSPYLTSLPNEYWWMLGIVLTFWFGGKIGENVIDKLRSGS
jgi:hypothetical protein